MTMISEDLHQVGGAINGLIGGSPVSDDSGNDVLALWDRYCAAGFSGILSSSEYEYLGSDVEIFMSLACMSTSTKCMVQFLHFGFLAPMILKRFIDRSKASEVLTNISRGDVRVAVSFESSVRSCRTDSGEIVVEGSCSTLLASSCNYIITTSDGGQEALGERLLLIDLTENSGWRSEQKTLDNGMVIVNVIFDRVVMDVESVLTEDSTSILSDYYPLYLAGTYMLLLQPARKCLVETIDYVCTRRQFDRSISSFQSVKHLLANLEISLCEIEGMYYCLLLNEREKIGLRCQLLSFAEFVSDKMPDFVNAIIQLHGGMGMTEDLPISGELKDIVVMSMMYSGLMFDDEGFVLGSVVSGSLNIASEGSIYGR